MLFTHIGGYIGSEIGGSALAGAVDSFIEFGHQTSQMNFGGDYHDAEAAYTMMARAVQDMGSSALNARMYLDKDAALFTRNQALLANGSSRWLSRRRSRLSTSSRFVMRSN